MPNWAQVDYVITGDDDQIDFLYQTMKNLQDMKESFVENGFGTSWLGNLVAKLGGDPKNIYCRGEWTYLKREEDGIVMSMEVAWGEPYEIRNFIEEKFPGIKIYFNSVTDESWWTNDRNGLFFDDRFFLYTDELGSGFLRNVSELISVIESLTGASDLHTLDECKKELNRHFNQMVLEDEYYIAYLGEYKIID